MLSLSALCYILEKVQVSSSDKDLIFINQPEFLYISDFSWCCVISGFLLFLRSNVLSFFFFFPSALLNTDKAVLVLLLGNYLVTLNQKCYAVFPFGSKGKDFLNLGPWLDSVIECHVDSFKIPFSRWRAEDILPKILSTSHICVFILHDIWIFTLKSWGHLHVHVVWRLSLH